MIRSIRRRAAFVGLALMMALGTQSDVAAQTTASTGVSVEVIDAGSFSVEIDTAGVTFSARDGSAPGVTAFSGTTAYATLPISLLDTRSDETRSGYEVRLLMGDLKVGEASSGSMIIPAGNIHVTGVDGLPEGASQGFGESTSLEMPVTLYSTGEIAPAVETTLEVSLQLEIPAGTMPGSFSGSISLEVIPYI